MGLVTDADELVRQRGEHGRKIRIGEVDPADDAEHEGGRRGRLEEPACLVECGTCLDEHRSADAVLAQQRREVVWAEGATDRRELIRQPGVVGERGIPEVLVRVDDQMTSRSGTSSAGPRFSRSQFSLCAMWSRVAARAKSASPAAIAS